MSELPDRQTSILIVEDDPEIREMLQRRLQLEGFAVVTQADGEGVVKTLEHHKIDLLLLDLTIPKESGMNVCKSVRAVSDLPIIIVTARGSTADKIMGLELGADDYLAKPFDPKELITRIRAVLRRAQPSPFRLKAASRMIRFDDWVLDIERRAVISPQNRLISLSAVEFKLLMTFLQHVGEPISRPALLEHMGEPDSQDRSADLQVSRLRSKLKSGDQTGDFIKTIRHVGYRFDAKVRAS